MTGEVVLPAERTTARLMVAGVGFETVGIVGLDVRLEIVGTGEGYESAVSNDMARIGTWNVYLEDTSGIGTCAWDLPACSRSWRGAR